MNPREQANMAGAIATEVAAVAGNLALTPTGIAVEHMTIAVPTEVSVQFGDQDTTAVDILAEAFSLSGASEQHPCYLREGIAQVANWTVKVVVYSGRPVDAPAEVQA